MNTKKVSFILLCFFYIVCNTATAAIIADHHVADISKIPELAIVKAKQKLHIAYGHTSHGSQIISGMRGLMFLMNDLGRTKDLYFYNDGGLNGALDLRTSPFPGAHDLGSPNRTRWAAATRSYLKSNSEINVIIWSWCKQVSTASEADINTYLKLMSKLERDFPKVKFVYMTGHLDGTGKNGNLNKRNVQIRNFCKTNNKILYDFADIESYDPEGRINYMELDANDNCDYDSDGDGSLDRNWAKDWQKSHKKGVDWYPRDAAHTEPLNGNRKAYAAWWLWTRLAGWNEEL